MNDDVLGAQQRAFQRGSLDQQVETASGGKKRKRKVRASNRMVPDGGGSSSGGEGRNGEFQARFGLSRGGASAAEGTEGLLSASTAVGDDEGGASSAMSVASDLNRGGRRAKTPRVLGGASTAAEAATAAVQDGSPLRWLHGVGRGNGEEVVEDSNVEDRAGAGASRRGGGERPSKMPRRLGGSGVRASSETAATETASVSGFQERVSSISLGGGGGGSSSGAGDSVAGREETVVGTVHSEGNFSSSSPLQRGVQESHNYPQTRRSSATRERLQSSLARGFASNNASLGTGEGNDSSGERRNGVGGTLGGVSVGTSASGSSRAGRGSRTSLSGGMVHEEARDGGASAASVDRRSAGARSGGGGVARGRERSAGSGREGNNGELVRLESEQDADGVDVAEEGGGVADAALGVVEEVGEGGNGDGDEMVAAALGVVQPENLTIDDFQCNICWEMLARYDALVYT